MSRCLWPLWRRALEFECQQWVNTRMWERQRMCANLPCCRRLHKVGVHKAHSSTKTNTHRYTARVPVITSLTSRGGLVVRMKPCPVLLSSTGSLVICSDSLAWKFWLDRLLERCDLPSPSNRSLTGVKEGYRLPERGLQWRYSWWCIFGWLKGKDGARWRFDISNKFCLFFIAHTSLKTVCKLCIMIQIRLYLFMSFHISSNFLLILVFNVKHWCVMCVVSCVYIFILVITLCVSGQIIVRINENAPLLFVFLLSIFLLWR